jgi:YVTN family beta-propeller protein
MRRLPGAGLLLAALLAGCSAPAGEPAAPAAQPPARHTTGSPVPSHHAAVSAVPPTAGPPQRLGVRSAPSDARVAIRTGRGRVISGTTPYLGTVPGGQVRITVTRNGYEPITRTVTVDRARQVFVWLDPKGQLLRSRLRFATGPNPKQVAFTPDGKQIWVSLLGGLGLQAVDSASGREIGRIRLGRHGAVEVIFTRDGGRAYASQMETASVYEVDTATRRVRRRLHVDGAWTKVLALSPDDRTLYAANWSSDTVSEIDLAAWKVRRVLKTVRTPRGLYPTPDGRRLYVAGFGKGEIQRIDLRSGRGTVLLRTRGAMRHLVGDGDTLYANDMARARVYAVDLRTEAVRQLARTDQKPNTMDLSPDGRLLFVSNRGANNPRSYYLPGPEWGSVLVLDTRTGRVLDAIVAGNQTTGLDVSNDGRRLAFSDFLDNRVRVYDVPAYAALVGGGGGRAPDYRAELGK